MKYLIPICQDMHLDDKVEEYIAALRRLEERELELAARRAYSPQYFFYFLRIFQSLVLSLVVSSRKTARYWFFVVSIHCIGVGVDSLINLENPSPVPGGDNNFTNEMSQDMNPSSSSYDSYGISSPGGVKGSRSTPGSFPARGSRDHVPSRMYTLLSRFIFSTGHAFDKAYCTIRSLFHLSVIFFQKKKIILCFLNVHRDLWRNWKWIKARRSRFWNRWTGRSTSNVNFEENGWLNDCHRFPLAPSLFFLNDGLTLNSWQRFSFAQCW